jgi:anthranilate synthase component 1
MSAGSRIAKEDSRDCINMLRPDFKQFAARRKPLWFLWSNRSQRFVDPGVRVSAIAEEESHAFLLESIERGEQIGRYTFLGVRPYLQVSARGDTVVVEHGSGRREKGKEQRGNILQVLKELLQQHRVASFPGLPPLTAGAVGYFAYDTVRQLENIGEHAKDDLSLPDCVLMFSTACWRSTTCDIRFTSSPQRMLNGKLRDALMIVLSRTSQRSRRS